MHNALQRQSKGSFWLRCQRASRSLPDGPLRGQLCRRPRSPSPQHDPETQRKFGLYTAVRIRNGRLWTVLETTWEQYPSRNECRLSQHGQFDQWQLQNRGPKHHEKAGRMKVKIMWLGVLTSFQVTYVKIVMMKIQHCLLTFFIVFCVMFNLWRLWDESFRLFCNQMEI